MPPNGKQVGFGTTDGILVLWDVGHRQMVSEPVAAHGTAINPLWYSPHGEIFISASDDHTIRFWDVTTGLSAGATFRAHTNGVLIAGFLADRGAETIVRLSKDNTVLLWQAQTGDAEHQLRIALEPRFLATLSNDCKKLLAVSGKDGTVRDTISAELIKTLSLETSTFLSVEFSRDFSRAALGLAECSLHMLVFDDDNLDSVLLEEHCYYIVWSSDSRTIAFVALDAALRIWDVEHRKCILGPHKTRGPTAFSPGGHFIVSSREGGLLDISTVRNSV